LAVYIIVSVMHGHTNIKLYNTIYIETLAKFRYSHWRLPPTRQTANFVLVSWVDSLYFYFFWSFVLFYNLCG